MKELKFAKAGNHLNDISKAIGAYAAKFKYGIGRDLVGHGNPNHLHEDPQIPNFCTEAERNQSDAWYGICY